MFNTRTKTIGHVALFGTDPAQRSTNQRRRAVLAVVVSASLFMSLMPVDAKQLNEGRLTKTHQQQKKQFRVDYSGLYGSARTFFQPAAYLAPPWPVVYCPGYNGDPSDCPGYYGSN
jgi:hypothetical protein